MAAKPHRAQCVCARVCDGVATVKDVSGTGAQSECNPFGFLKNVAVRKESRGKETLT